MAGKTPDELTREGNGDRLPFVGSRSLNGERSVAHRAGSVVEQHDERSADVRHVRRRETAVSRSTRPRLGRDRA